MSKGRRGWNLRGPDKPVVRGDEHYAWKGDAALPSSKRQRARFLYDLGPCEDCGQAAVERHHKDGDTGNNAPENIALLCRRCHMERDGRMNAFKEMARANGRTAEPKPCENCGRLYKPLRRGRCAACNVYLRRTGRERSREALR